MIPGIQATVCHTQSLAHAVELLRAIQDQSRTSAISVTVLRARLNSISDLAAQVIRELG